MGLINVSFTPDTINSTAIATNRKPVILEMVSRQKSPINLSIYSEHRRISQLAVREIIAEITVTIYPYSSVKIMVEIFNFLL